MVIGFTFLEEDVVLELEIKNWSPCIECNNHSKYNINTLGQRITFQRLFIEQERVPIMKVRGGNYHFRFSAFLE